MADSYPYIISNNKIGPILNKIETAAKPQRFTYELLKKMGFVSSNDRAIVSVLKGLGFLTQDGAPTEYYDRLKDSTDHKYVLGERIRELYRELYAVDTEMHKAPDEEIKGAFSRITGKDARTVGRYFLTYKTLVGLAEFGSTPTIEEKGEKSDNISLKNYSGEKVTKKTDFHYNIQIHLPATTDISVYNSIFKALKENLLID